MRDTLKENHHILFSKLFETKKIVSKPADYYEMS